MVSDDILTKPYHAIHRSWIFILEGLATVLAGAASFFIIQDFPDTARFLSEEERTFVIQRLQTDNQFSAGGENLRWKNVQKSFTDYKTWLSAMNCVGSSRGDYVL